MKPYLAWCCFWTRFSWLSNHQQHHFLIQGVQNSPLSCNGQDPHPLRCQSSNAFNFHRCMYNKRSVPLCPRRDLGPVVMAGAVPISAAPLYFSLLVKNTKAAGRHHLLRTPSHRRAGVKTPSAHLKASGINLYCSLIDLLMFWYSEVKRVMMNLSTSTPGFSEGWLSWAEVTLQG